MDLRTFIKPDGPRWAPVPEIGKPAPALPGAPPAFGRPRIVAFLRHVGCPFAELTMKTLDEASARHPEVQFLAVSQGTPAATRRWCAELQIGYGVTVIDDPAREMFAAWGLGLTSLRHFLGLRSVGRAVSLARRGIRNRHPSGTRWQQAGTFGLDADGTLRWRHLPEHAGDVPDVEAAVRAVTTAAPLASPTPETQHGRDGAFELR
ncbi:MAG TPA: AhpC/TSA family protein [Candidatus Limnocylindria bacterium]|nr:AhpC/TSA family protein [Candidatus Limnocylindria bacterium]